MDIIDNINIKRIRVKTIRNDNSLWKWVLAKSKNLNNVSDSERLYFALYGKNKECIFNNIKYVSFSVGYIFCAPANACLCAKTSVKNKVKQTKSKYTISRKKEILDKRVATLNNRYCVHNIFQLDNIKCKARATMVQKYGVETPRQCESINNKIKKTCLIRYGVDNPLKSKIIKDKIKKTNIARYGVDSPLKSKIIKDKIKKTNIARYGVDSPLKSKIIKDKIKKTNIARYGVDNIFSSAEMQKTIKKKQRDIFYDNLKHRTNNMVNPNFKKYEYIGTDKKYSWKCNVCNNIFIDTLVNGRIPVCHNCYPLNQSHGEREVKEFLKSLNVVIFENDRNIIKPYELDIVIPSKKIAIEYNGLYWHSEVNGKDKTYHKMKLDMCNKVGYQLITIFEDEWINKRKGCEVKLKQLLDINKRIINSNYIVINEISNKDYEDFVNIYHIKEFIDTTVKVGAYYNNELIAVMGFNVNKSKITNKYNLLCFCIIDNIYDIGSKLFKYFIKIYKPTEIISHYDLRWDTGIFYEDLGFVLSYVSAPDYWYVGNKKKREFRTKYSKHSLIEMSSYSKDKTEWQIMKEEGYNRIWDCGNKIVKYNKDNKCIY